LPSRSPRASVEGPSAGDAGAMVNRHPHQGKAHRRRPLRVDNTFLSRALRRASSSRTARPSCPGAGPVPPRRRGPRDAGRLRRRVRERRPGLVSRPRSRSAGDARRPRPPRLPRPLVVENPPRPSPGLAFLLATVARYGDGGLDYWKQLRGNGVRWSPAGRRPTSGEFSGSSGHGPGPWSCPTPRAHRRRSPAIPPHRATPRRWRWLGNLLPTVASLGAEGRRHPEAAGSWSTSSCRSASGRRAGPDVRLPVREGTRSRLVRSLRAVPPHPLHAVARTRSGPPRCLARGLDPHDAAVKGVTG